MQIPLKRQLFFFFFVVLQLESPHIGALADLAVDIGLTLCERWPVSDAGGHIQLRYHTERQLLEMAGKKMHKNPPEPVWSCSQV